MKKEAKKALLGASAFLIFLFIQSYSTVPLLLLGVDIENLSMTARVLYMFAVDIILIITMFFLFKDSLKKDFADIKKNHKKYFSECFKYWIIGIIAMLLSNLIILLLKGDATSQNQEAINSLFQISPLYIFFACTVEAPFVEELVFRRGIKNIFPTPILFILASGLLFGGMHVVGSITTLSDLLYIIPYGALGCAFAYILQKTDNIFVTMGFHFLHNGLLISLQFLLLLF